MAQTVIFAEQTFTSYLDDLFGYCYFVDGVSSDLFIVGETYRIAWDGSDYSCQAIYDGVILGDVVFVGNASQFGFPANDEPFIISPVDGGMLFVCLEDVEPTEHRVTIYKSVADDPQEEVGIVIKNYSGEPVTYTGVEKVMFNASDGGTQIFSKGEAVEGVPIALDLADGDQTVTAPAGMLVKSAIIQKPDTLTPENIVKGIEIAGVVGTSEGGGDEGLDLYEPEWIDDVCFWDYDGTLLLHIPLAQAKSLSELPTPPAHDGLIFQEWNYTLDEIRETKYPIDVGATYTTADGKTHAVLKITNSSYKAVPVCFMQSVANGVTIDWGDGSTSQSGTTTGASITLTHTYTAIGTYEIVFEVAEGCIMQLGGGTSSLTFVGKSTTNYRRYLDKLHIGDRVEFSSSYALRNNDWLTAITFPKGLTEIPTYVFPANFRLASLVIPRGVTTLGNYACGGFQWNPDETFRRWGVISFPATVTTVGNGGLQASSAAIRRLCVPAGVTALPDYSISSLGNALRIFMPDNVKTFGNNVIYGCSKLPEIVLPKELETIGGNCFYGCASLTKITLTNKLVSVGEYFLYETYSLKELIIPESLISIAYNRFCEDSGIKRVIIHSQFEAESSLPFGTCLNEIVFTTTTPPPGAKRILNSLTVRRVFVPDESLTAYRTALGTNYYYELMPISEYKGSTPIARP